MTHLFKQMYADEVNFEDALTQNERIDLIFIELVRHKMVELRTLEECAGEMEVEKDVSKEENLCVNFGVQAIDMVDGG